MVKEGDTITVWFSCGAASAVAAKTTVDIYGTIANVIIVNNPVIEEHPDNRRFMKDVELWIGRPIFTATNPKYPSCSAREVWTKRSFMAGREGAPCTLELKKRARQQWESLNTTDWLVMGFTSDELRRSLRFSQSERSNLLPVLINQGLSKNDCFNILIRNGIKLPEMYTLGYPNANCIGCVKATSPTYWNHVRKTHPHVFDDRAKQSREIGAKLVRVNGKRIYLDELEKHAKGKPMRKMTIECGIFCEEGV